MVAERTSRLHHRILAICVAATLLAVPGRAQVAQPTPSDGPLETLTYPITELEACRATLVGIASNLYEITGILGDHPARSQSARVWTQFQEFTPAQLEQCMPVIDQINELSDTLSRFHSELLVPSVQKSTFGDACPDPAVLPTSHCEGLPSADYLVPVQVIIDIFGNEWVERGSTVLEGIALIAINVADGIYAAINDVSEQTAAGFNAAATGAPFAIVLSIVKGVFAVLQMLDDDVNSAEIEGSYERLAHLHKDMGQMAADVESVKSAGAGLADEVAALRTEIEALRKANCEIIRLLHTPPKKRASVCATCDDQPGFPYEYQQKK